MIRILLFLIFNCFAFQAIAQLPITEVFLLKLKDNDRIEKVALLSGFNPNQYNNQPFFISDNEVLLTCALEKNNTDIVKLNLQANTWKRMTATAESEYSPKLNGEANFTVVRVEKDGKTQTLWEYPLSLNYEGDQLLKNTGQVGYYKALPNFKMALFVIENTMNLYVSNMRNDTKSLVEKNIGRCFQLSKKGELLFVSKLPDTEKGTIKSYNTVNKSIKNIAPTMLGAEDFCLFGSNESIIMAKGNKLYKYDQQDSTWILWKDLSSYGLENITRIEARGNQILLVNNL